MKALARGDDPFPGTAQQFGLGIAESDLGVGDRQTEVAPILRTTQQQKGVVLLLLNYAVTRVPDEKATVPQIGTRSRRATVVSQRLRASAKAIQSQLQPLTRRKQVSRWTPKRA